MGAPFRQTNLSVTGERTVSARGTLLDIEAVFHPRTAAKFGLKVLSGTNGDQTVVGYEVSTGRVYIDRTNSGTAALTVTGFSGVHSAPLRLRDGTLNLRILIDKSIVEVFAEDGERVLTDLVYPATSSDGIKVFAEGGSASLDALTVYRMRSTWPDSQVGTR
jgi:levanase